MYVAIGFFLAVLMAILPTNLAAQTSDYGFPPQLTQFKFNRALIATWEYTRGFTGFTCGAVTGPYGNPQGTCQYPVDQVEPLMNERAKAWFQWFDEPISGKWACVGSGLNMKLSEPYLWNFTTKPEAVIQHFEHSNWIRYIWVDGRPHPPADEGYQYGHSIGRMEGDIFVVETTNFSFDVDGWDDHVHLPTSHLKKMVERYRVVSPGQLEIQITVEDPLFLKGPVTWTNPYRKTDKTFVGEWNCDPEVGLRHLYETIPQKYKDDVLFEKYRTK